MRISNSLAYTLSLVLAATSGCSRSISRVVGTGATLHRMEKKHQGKPDEIETQYFAQTLDHFDPSNLKTFQQRYSIYSEYASGPSAPVVFYVCGEGNCMNGEFNLKEWPAQMAKKMGAYFVGLEHRYYGKSQPFDTMTADTFRYLTVEQALEDLVTFQKWVVSSRKLGGKWITFGGSYPASLAAIARMQHPELFSGAIASSACVKLDKGSSSSDRVAAQDVGKDCVAKFRKSILTPIQKAIGNADAMAPIKKAFDAADIQDDLDFMGALTGMSIAVVQYGGKDDFCKALDDKDPMASYGQLMSKFVEAFGGKGSRLINWSYEGNADPKSSLYDGAFGFRQWVYQACTQEGLYTAAVMKANPDTSLSLSSTLTDSLPEKYCSEYFGISALPAIDEMNKKYYEPLLDPSTSNILFVSGNNDPACFPDAIAQENGNATNPNTVSFTVDGGTHCQDMTAPTGDDSDSLRKARDLELQLATKWAQ